MNHIGYQTICALNGHYYLGVHSTEDLDDGYLGSGLELKRAIKAHGKGAFSRHDVAFFDTRDEAYEWESRVVTPEVVADPRSYNRRLGGAGPGATLSDESCAIISAKATARYENPANRAKHSVDCKKGWAATAEVRAERRKPKQIYPRPPRKKYPPVTAEARENMRQAQLGRTHPPETLAKMSDSAKGRWESMDEAAKKAHGEKVSAGKKAAFARKRRELEKGAEPT